MVYFVPGAASELVVAMIPLDGEIHLPVIPIGTAIANQRGLITMLHLFRKRQGQMLVGLKQN